jgi:hypothetical protein
VFSEGPNEHVRTGVMLFGLLNCVGLVATAMVKVKFQSRLLRAILLISGSNYAAGQITDFLGMNLGDSPMAHLALATGSAVFYLLLLLQAWQKIDLSPTQPTVTAA